MKNAQQIVCGADFSPQSSRSNYETALCSFNLKA